MKNNFALGITALLIVMSFSCNRKNQDLKFYSCEFDSSGSKDSIYFSKWVDNKEEASKAKLTLDSSLNKRNLDSLYKEIGQYLFVIGGGGIYVGADDCSASIQNDSILIKYNISATSGAVGEMASSSICLEINRKKYPNYKNMKVVYVEE